MTARLSAAEARALGITGAPAAKKRTTRKVASGPYRTKCSTCNTEFTTAASEDRHCTETHHSRYELVLS